MIENFSELVSCVPETEPLIDEGNLQELLACADTLYDYEVRWVLNGGYSGLKSYDTAPALDLTDPVGKELGSLESL